MAQKGFSKMAFQIGDKVEVDLNGTPWTGTVESLGAEVVWVKSDQSKYTMPFRPDVLKKFA